MSECTHDSSGGAELPLRTCEDETSRSRISDAYAANKHKRIVASRSGKAKTSRTTKEAAPAVPNVTAQIVSRKWVTKHGEVFTAEREVNAMLDLVKHETERIESRFLEPACGSGNFLDAILRRKLNVVKRRHQFSRTEFERDGVTAVASIYGIELQMENVIVCRERLFNVFVEVWRGVFGRGVSARCSRTLRFILGKNIIWGDALTLKQADLLTESIVFSEWSPIGECLLQRRDFMFENLLRNTTGEGENLFRYYSDSGAPVFISNPIREYTATHYLEVSNAEK
jgi:hypothetical protein